MKKIIALFLTVCLLIVCVSCSTAAWEGEAKDFSVEGMTLTLTDNFRQITADGYTACFDTSTVAVFVIKEDFSAMEGAAGMSLEDYGAFVYDTNFARNPSEPKTVEGLLTMEYSYENTQQKITYRYFTVMYKSHDAFWTVQFSCAESNYEENYPHFIECAKAITFDAAE